MSQTKFEILRQVADLARLEEFWSLQGRDDLARIYRIRAANLDEVAAIFE